MSLRSFWKQRGSDPDGVARAGRRADDANEVIRRLQKHREVNHLGAAFNLAFGVHREKGPQ